MEIFLLFMFHVCFCTICSGGNMRLGICIVFILFMLLTPSYSVIDPSDFSYSTKKIQGDSIVVTCQYFQKFLFSDVYRIEDCNGVVHVITKAHGTTKFLKSNIICINFMCKNPE